MGGGGGRGKSQFRGGWVPDVWSGRVLGGKNVQLRDRSVGWLR